MTIKESKNELGALILSSSHTSLGVIRGLGRHGIKIFVVYEKKTPPVFSRYVKGRFRFKGDNEEDRVAFLIDLANKNNLNRWAIFPDSDRWAIFLAKNQNILDKYYTYTTPPWDILQWSIDKRLTYQLAEEIGIGYPLTYYPKNRADVLKINGSFPMVLKPAHREKQDLFSEVKVWQVNNKEELLARYDMACESTDNSNILIQEMIPGGADSEFSYAALCRNGKVLADVFAARKRMRPIDFGVSVYAETILKPEIEIPARLWLEKNCYTGLVEIDFKYDARDDQYKLLDVNSRAWGWIVLCSSAGVNFPLLLWRLLTGENVDFVRARPGVRWFRAIFDLISAMKLIRKGELSFRGYVSSLKGAKHQTLAFGDPLPVLIECLTLLGHVLKKRFHLI